jgi:hypothetical protein
MFIEWFQGCFLLACIEPYTDNAQEAFIDSCTNNVHSLALFLFNGEVFSPLPF